MVPATEPTFRGKYHLQAKRDNPGDFKAGKWAIIVIAVLFPWIVAAIAFIRWRGFRSPDINQDPFASPSRSKSRDAVRVRPLATDRRPQPPHITPDFVQINDPQPIHRDAHGNIDIPRQISAGGVWNVGGRMAAESGPLPGVPDGSGRLLSSGSNAPMYTAQFLDRKTSDEDLERHENRLAVALDIDPANRILSVRSSSPRPGLNTKGSHPLVGNTPFIWRDNVWTREQELHNPKTRTKSIPRAVPATPFRVLDAPRLRDDFYCSSLAYSNTSRTLAVGLSSRVYLWSEDTGVQYPPLTSQRSANYVTSLSFSSTGGGKSILAVGRQGGQVALWSCCDAQTRFEAQQPHPVSCLSFKPTVSLRRSEFFQGQRVQCEDLLVGDDVGNVFYYSVEWPQSDLQRSYPDWTGSMTLLAKISAHSQQVCGIAWSPDGNWFATGGNDNCALLFQTSRIVGRQSWGIMRQMQCHPLQPSSIASVTSPITPPSSPTREVPRGRSMDRSSQSRRSASPPPPRRLNPNAPNFTFRRISPPITLRPTPNTTTAIVPTPHGPRPVVNLITPPTSPQAVTTPPVALSPQYTRGTTIFSPLTSPTVFNHTTQSRTHAFAHTAAVKAIAFAPWQSTLLATGGGSNDRQIHFWHTGSGAPLATINVHAQVTSLIWSRTRRELCATFGYAQPEHGIRIAVFAWPSGECVVAIPWTSQDGSPGGDGGRALWAIPYPGGPNERRTSVGSGGQGGRSVEGNGEGGVWWSRTAEEGCVIVASSDESVKFHEVWSGARKGGKRGKLGGQGGVLGGSSVLEGICEGIDDCGGNSRLGDGFVIR
ncbi:MAG: hypothetical protein Q9160_004814 [Pyrenula sp. 1 TL-2023]